MVQAIKNLQVFCTQVLDNKLLWTPEILEFFSVPEALLLSFESEREKYQ